MVVPFEGRLELVDGELPGDGDDAIVMGSYTLARVAKAHGWEPGAFLDNLDFVTQRERWGEHMLNHDASVCKLGEASAALYERHIVEPFFIRPVYDTKSFTGQVMDLGELEAWCERLAPLSEQGGAEVDLLTRVMVCTKKEIHTETRVWVVGRRIVTASGYKLGTLKRYSPPHATDPQVLHFVNARIDQWVPNEAFVIDVAQTPGGPKIVEVNNLNSAGFYKGDMQALVAALESYHGNPEIVF